MGKKPVLGLAALSLVSCFAVSGCWSDGNALCPGGSCKGGQAPWASKNAAAKQQQQQPQQQWPQQQQPQQQMMTSGQGQQLPPAWNQGNPNGMGGVQPANFNQPGQGLPPASFKPNVGGGVNDPAFQQVPNNLNLQGAAVNPLPPPNPVGQMPATSRARGTMVIDDNPRPMDLQPTLPPQIPVHVTSGTVHSVPNPAPVTDLTSVPPIPAPPMKGAGGMTISDATMLPTPPAMPAQAPVSSTRIINQHGVEIQPAGGPQD